MYFEVSRDYVPPRLSPLRPMYAIYVTFIRVPPFHMPDLEGQQASSSACTPRENGEQPRNPRLLNRPSIVGQAAILYSNSHLRLSCSCLEPGERKYEQ